MKKNRSGEPLILGDMCGVPVANKPLAGEVMQMKIEIRNWKAEIKEMKEVKDKKN